MNRLIDLGPDDYELCKKALNPGGDLTPADSLGRQQWCESIVTIWEDCVRAEYDPVAHITVWEDATATHWPGRLGQADL